MKTTLHIQILGKFSVANGDQITTRLRTRKTELLLAYLATRKGKPARREELAELFWPDEEESTARHKLRLALTSIRAAVGDHLTSDRLVVGLNDASLDADDLIQTNCAGLTPETETQVLPGYESFWINEVQAAIDSAIDQRIREGAAGAIDTENSASARLWLALNAKHHSLSKSVKQELISLLDRSGDKRGVQLFAPAKQAPPKSGRFVDVPEPRGILFGREQELIHLCEMLLGDNEPVLVTLQALSGVGKTRLSQELCKLAAIDEFEVVWISLDGIEDADRARSLTLQKLVDTQDIQELRSLPPTLLVLDNVEQLPQDAWRSTLDELLAHGDSLRIVQTSHHASRAQNERVLHLAPVEIPPRQATDVAANPGIKIFLQRRARAGFESTDAKDLDNIAQICRLLGGLPLAIELAASASLFMPLTDLCESVATATTTLQQHDPLAKRLHQRLDLALTWSLSHVSEDAQTLVKRLANFSGSHPAALIQNLCEDLSSPYQAICQELLDRSLITQDGTLENPRFSLLGAMRVFLQPKSAGVEQVAADAYRKFALSVALDLSTDRYTIAATEAAFQVANLGNTIRRAAESRHWDEVSNLARLLYFGRHRHGELELASEELAEWLALPGLTDPNTLSTLTSLLGHVQYFQFELELASSTYQKSLVFAEQAGDETAQRVSLANVGLCALALGRFDEAFEVLTAAHGKLSLQDPERRRTTLELNIADAIYGQGKPEEAIERLQTILTRLETVTELDNFRGLACQNIARIKFAEGNAGEAEPWLQQALVSQLAINELTRIRPIRSSLAEIAIEKGDIDQAEQELKHILEDKSIRPRDLPPNIFLALAKFAKARNDNAASELFASKFRVLLDSKRTWLYPPERRKFLEQFQQAPPEFLPSDRELLALARRLIRL